MEHFADFRKGDVVKVHSGELGNFALIASANQSKKRYRLCMHDSPDNRLQEMLICRMKRDYAIPHKHINMAESHMIVDGSEMIVLFSDTGDIVDAFVVERDKGYLFYRVNADIYHMLIVLTESAIDYEVKVGPFDKENNFVPPWAPVEGEKEAVADFMSDVLKRAIRLIRSREKEAWLDGEVCAWNP